MGEGGGEGEGGGLGRQIEKEGGEREKEREGREGGEGGEWEGEGGKRGKGRYIYMDNYETFKQAVDVKS